MVGRHRDTGTESFATVRETADALGVKVQAIYNRIHADPPTIPAERHMDPNTLRATYRIPRDWLDAEVLSRARAASVADVRQTVEELNTAGVERVLEAIRAILSETDQNLIDGIAALMEENRQMAGEFFGPRFVEVLEHISEQRQQVSEAIAKQESEVSSRLDSMAEMFKDARDTERAYQHDNLQLAKENRDLQRQTLELLSRVEAVETERAERGRDERRSFWRRLFGD